MDTEHNSNSTVAGPGSILHRAREEKGFSQEEVAQSLHLAPRQIIALENDDISGLPGATYVRGYLRSYAELLGLPPEPVLAAYTSLLGDQKKTPNLGAIAPKEEITSQHHQMKFATYAVVAITLALAFMWWQGREDDAAKPAFNTAMQADETEAQTAPGTAEGVAPDADPVMPPTGPAGTLLPPAVVAAPGIAPAAGVAAQQPVLAPVAAKPPVPVVVPPAETRSAPLNPQAPEYRASLVVVTEEECWVDVRDVHQNKLLYETVPAGRRVVLEGAVPFSVFLGNVAGVKVEFNGKPYDALRHQRGLVARFTLGRELVPPAAATMER